jgi:SAM-dependent methyltransferase
VRIRQAVKAVVPGSWVHSIQKYQGRRFTEKCADLTVQQIFSKIYDEGAWGRSGDPSQPFFSGSGSHDDKIIATYVDAVRGFLSTFPDRPDVVDLGCGDFFVGSKIRDLCGAYVACDIVPKLIEFNKKKFAGLDVDFRVVDMTSDELPGGDVVFIRQVLQHLSNEQIARAVPKVAATYKSLVLTEHLPDAPDFEPNRDKRAGPEVRTGAGSGVVLTSPPFNLEVTGERTLCQIDEFGSVIKTTLYTLA